MAAVALGGGIWSMHFVAMLGLTLPILFYYDALITLISALVAILMVGVALLVLHFLPRTRRTVTAAGAIVGLGIAAMHYIGMSGIQLCTAVYTPAALALAWAASVGLGIGSFRIIHHRRRRQNLALGTLSLGISVFAVHFIAMGGTGFTATISAATDGPLLDNATLAMIVTVAAFVICGAFLLTGVGFLPEEADQGPIFAAAPADAAFRPVQAASEPAVGQEGALAAQRPGDPGEASAGQSASSDGEPGALAPSPLQLGSSIAAPGDSTVATAAESFATGGTDPPPNPQTGVVGRGFSAPDKPTDKEPQSDPMPPAATERLAAARVPFEREGRTLFVDRSAIAAVRAEGHYTTLYVDGQELFCPWSITEAAARLPEPYFVRAHRSYLINVGHVTGFERRKDNGICLLAKAGALAAVPVSRGRLPAVRQALGV
nr:MHYT domain-containing protein [Aurantimonas sp. VKM B-3413]